MKNVLMLIMLVLVMSSLTCVSSDVGASPPSNESKIVKEHNLANLPAVSGASDAKVCSDVYVHVMPGVEVANVTVIESDVMPAYDVGWSSNYTHNLYNTYNYDVSGFTETKAPAPNTNYRKVSNHSVINIRTNYVSYKSCDPAAFSIRYTGRV